MEGPRADLRLSSAAWLPVNPCDLDSEQMSYEDDYVQHLAKVEGILNHLESLGPQHDDELFLMVDGYDAWFQLPPDILVQRYHSIVDSSTNRYAADESDFTNTVIFGQDKLCWPGTASRAACWAVPDSTLWSQAFGPDTDYGIVEHNRPRWLNSGTIIGPVKDVRDIFTATLEKIREHHSENSDQFYFANVFAEQSYARGPTTTQQWPNITESPQEGPEALEIPRVPSSKRTEYGIGIDYESSLFQTVAFYEDYITWITYYNSTQEIQPKPTSFHANNPYHHFPLPSDLATSFPPPGPKDKPPTSPLPATWFNLPLATNTITKQIAPLIHFTGKKGYREMWWHRNWFYPVGKELLRWRQSVDAGAGDARTAGEEARVLPWERLCWRYEEYLFGESGAGGLGKA
ncbi:MAG: hypothetical protein Q9227_003667 [Pyrenula ochraceoflavens]